MQVWGSGPGMAEAGQVLPWRDYVPLGCPYGPGTRVGEEGVAAARLDDDVITRQGPQVRRSLWAERQSVPAPG